MLKVEGLVASYSGLVALDGVSLTVGDGEFVAVIGANGAGKTTLVKSLLGLIRPDAGHIYFDGKEITGRPSHEIVGMGVAVVPEGRRLFPELTVAENLALGAYVASRRKGKSDRLEWVLQIFPRLKERMNQLAGLMSGGEQMLLAIGRALMSDPKLLVLDEPSLGLAPKTTDEVLQAVVTLNKSGRSVLLVEQNVIKALRLSSRAYAMANGRVVLEGTDLLERPEVKQAYLGL